MANYQIKITPVEYYFFGGEKHNENLEADYFVESVNYPQQTTLLGMLRYFLLQKNNLLGGKSLPTDKQNAANGLIGEQSFEYNSEHTFGKIQTISPLYFSKNEKKYFFAPIDLNFEMNDDYVLLNNGKIFNSKEYSGLIQQYLISADFNNKIAVTDIIEDIIQVGNEKGKNGATIEKAFYKQKMKRLNKDWSFVIDADIDVELEEKDCFIPFGGEKCYFKLSFKKQAPFNPSYPENHIRNISSILCISDCFVDGNKIKEVEFAVNDFISFRNFRSKLITQNFYALKKEKKIEEGIIRSSRYQLLQRGSVLYFSDKTKRDDFALEIEGNSSSTIGFNKILKN